MKLYRIFLPKKYNNGKKIPDKKFREIADQLMKKFKTYSFHPHAQLPLIEGEWVGELGKIYKDECFCIEIFVQDTFDNQKWLKSFTEIVRQLLKQTELFVLCQNAEQVKFEI